MTREPSSGEFLMGLDLGGGGARCVLLNTRTGAATHAARPCPPRRTPGTGGLGIDLDLDGIWSALCEAASEALGRAGATPDRVLGIGATSIRLGTVVLDVDGHALLAVPNTDARAAGEGLRMAAEHGAALQARTGHWPYPIFAAPRLQWLAAQRPEAWQRAAHVLSISDWVTWKLCGEALAEPSQASVTLLLGLEAPNGADLAWDWPWIDELGFPHHLFPELRTPGSAAGTLTEAAAAALGLRAGTPIAVGGADTQCALLGMGATAPLDVAAVAGSTAPVEAVVDRPIRDERLWTAHHVVPGRFVVESNGGPMGEVVEWVSRLLYPETQEPIAKLFGEAAMAEPGATGHLSTLGTDVMHARSMGMPIGTVDLNSMASASDGAPRKHFARAIAEGLACGLRANLEQIRSAVGEDLHPLRLGGGLARSDTWTAIVADVLDAPLHVAEGPQVTARGAALLAGVAAGVYPDAETAGREGAAAFRTVEPTPERAATSQGVYTSWTQLREARTESTVLAQNLGTPWVLRAHDTASGGASARTRPRFLVCADFDEASLDALRALGEVEYASYRKKMRLLSGAALVEAAREFDVLVTEIDLVDADSLGKLPDLRVVASCRGDAVNVDIPACTLFGVPVLNAPGRNADAVADLTVAFLLMLARRLPAASTFLRQPGMEAGDMGKMGQAFSTLQGRELWQKTVGLVGLGAVGRAVAARLSGFGARVVVSDPFVSPEEAARADATWLPLDELLAQSDFVSLHAAVTDATRGLIGADQLAAMKPGACLVNTARAALADEDALAEALQTGQLGGLAVDTFSVEPPGSDHPLLAFDNVIATPHVGGNTTDVAAHQGRIIVEDLRRLLSGERPLAAVNPEVLDDFSWDTERSRPNDAELAALLDAPGPAVSDLQKDEKPPKKSARERVESAGPDEAATTSASATASASTTASVARAMEALLQAFVASIVADETMAAHAADQSVALHFSLSDLGLEFWFGLDTGVVTGAVGPPPEPAAVQLRMAAEILDGMFSGTGNPMQAAMDGRLSFTGDAAKAMALQTMNADLVRLYASACDAVGGPVDLTSLDAPEPSRATARAGADGSSGDALCDELVRVVDELYAAGVITATGGNVSARIPGTDEIWITPSQLFKGDLAPEVLVRIDFAGRHCGGADRSPSSEWPMHAAVFRARPEVQAVVHAHAPNATILCNSELPFLPVSTEAAFFGNIARIPFVMPGTDALADAIVDALSKEWAVLMQNHGILVAGRSLRRAADMVEIVERTAEVILGGYAVGKPPPVLPDEAVETFRRMGDIIA